MADEHGLDTAPLFSLGQPAAAPEADCGCTEPDRHIQANPMSSACAGRECGGCTGYTDGYETYTCGHGCHWCPSGLHRRERSRG